MHPSLAGTMRAASCAFVGSGHFTSFHDINKIIKIKKTFVSNPETFPVFDTLFLTYKNVYSGLKKAYRKANAACHSAHTIVPKS